MESILANIAAAAQPLAAVLYTLVITALVDVGSGLWAAYRSRTLDWQFADTFVRSHVFQKWGPIMGSLLAGVAIGGTGDVIGATLIAAGVAQIAAYEASTISSVFGIGSPTDGNLKAAQDKTKGLPSSVAAK